MWYCGFMFKAQLRPCSASQSCWRCFRFYSQLSCLMISLCCYLSITRASSSETQSRAPTEKQEGLNDFLCESLSPGLVLFHTACWLWWRDEDNLSSREPFCIAVPLPNSQILNQRWRGTFESRSKGPETTGLTARQKKSRGGHERKQLVAALSNWFQQESSGVLVSLWGSAADGVDWRMASTFCSPYGRCCLEHIRSSASSHQDHEPVSANSCNRYSSPRVMISCNYRRDLHPKSFLGQHL